MSVEELVVLNAGWIRQKAHQFYSNHDDADDLAGETIYRCLSQDMRFDSGRSFKPWATTIMKNLYITQYNRLQCVRFTDYEEYEQPAVELPADQRTSVNRILSIIRECNRKSCCIECVLLYAKGYSYNEISERIGIPVGTVKSRVVAGRKMLRNALD